MSTAVIVFARAPVPGATKTRLVPALGAAGAALLAERLLAHAVAAAVEAGVGPVELCVTPDATHPFLARVADRHEIAMTFQGDGDLGERMSRALARSLSLHDAAVLIGSDAPALDAAALRAAATALASGHDAVFVPALDGGYALVGLSRPAPELFAGMAWSTSRVMADTRERARRAGLRCAELAPVADIDEPADLAQLPPEWLR